jgi:ATP-binding cassette subfamily B protein
MAKTEVSLVRLQRDPSDIEEEMRPLEWGLIRRLFGYTRPYAAKRNWLLLTVLLRGVQFSLISKMIGSIIGLIGEIRADPTRGTWHDVLAQVGWFAALVLFTNFCWHFRYRLSLELGEAVVTDLRDGIFRHLMRMPMSFFHRTKLGRIISRITSDVEVVRSGVQEVLFVSLVQGGQMLVAAVFMLMQDWKLFLIVLAMAPILWAINRHFRAALSQATRAAQESYSQISATLAESVNGIRAIQGFNRQEMNAENFGNLLTVHARNHMFMAQTSAVLNPLLDFNIQVFTAALIVVGGYQVLSLGQPDVHHVENLIQFYFFAGLFFGPILSIGTQYNHALVCMAGAERVFHLLDAKPEWQDEPAAADVGTITGKVEFRNLSFGYDPGRLVLNDINFTAEAGQTVALVGHTGSGKSTIINLISKFYLPTAGELLIDDREIRSITGNSLHRNMGIVLQANFLFTGTVYDNIRVGRPDATDEQVRQAARDLDCYDLIEELPEGFNTLVGEKGSKLSLGQRQIVCFTRAILANPRIMILDEATSSIDAITEARLQKALAILLRGRTSFVVAHRLSTIRHADVVLVLDHGKIIERGTHRQLLAKKGQYATLYREFAQERKKK